MKITVYSDASYNHRYDISTCGFIICTDKKIIIHRVYALQGIGSVQGSEIWALTKALQDAFLLKEVSFIDAYTDALMIISRKKRHKRYTELDETIEIIRDYKIPLIINHVKAHRQNSLNNKVDNSCRQYLRKFLKKYLNGRKAA